jgi:DNA replication licensing factor MCM6
LIYGSIGICVVQIIPQFVKEAYSLLRQSIIHVEQDDIAFDDDDGPAGAGGNNISADEANVLDQIESSYNAQNSMGIDSMDAQAGSFPRSPTAAQPSSSSAAGAARSSSVQPAQTSQADPRSTSVVRPPAPKPKMKITYDEFVSIQTLILLTLSEKERTTGKGMDKDEIIDFWLEKKEDQMTSEDDVTYQTELIKKVLNKLVKVCILILYHWIAANAHFSPVRITSSL